MYGRFKKLLLEIHKLPMNEQKERLEYEFSKWKGRAEDPVALEEATAYVMSAVTRLLEQLRGESAPLEIFDPKKSSLPRIGNFKRGNK